MISIGAAPPITLALAGDTMLGRGVAERLAAGRAAPLLDPAVVEAATRADLFVVNLECCISARGERFPDPDKPFFFRAPPPAADWLAAVGVDCATLANNHALDYGPVALLDTLEHLALAGVAAVGGGASPEAARAPVVLESGGIRLRVVAATDHPAAYAAARGSPGVAFAPLRRSGRLPDWLRDALAPGPDADLVLAAVHWGPNMVGAPVAAVRAAAPALLAAGADLVAGHSAHVFHGAAGAVLYDLGDFLDDYRVDRDLRNDLGLLWFVTLDAGGPRHVEALPLALDYCHTRPAMGGERDLVERLLAERCAAVGSRVERHGDRLAVVGG
jgi:poly-gamma-glutamate synthesis protein (capsule biosynthesis protein)